MWEIVCEEEKLWRSDSRRSWGEMKRGKSMCWSGGRWGVGGKSGNRSIVCSGRERKRKEIRVSFCFASSKSDYDKINTPHPTATYVFPNCFSCFGFQILEGRIWGKRRSESWLTAPSEFVERGRCNFDLTNCRLNPFGRCIRMHSSLPHQIHCNVATLPYLV